MKLIAKQTIKSGGKYIPPGSEFDLDSDAAKALIEAGAAEQKTRRVADDDEDDAPAGPASGQTRAPDPDQVAKAAASAKRT